ncbi:hypothetical protein AUR64_13800 [Haloprofundus marisrubri]|uniref:fructose-bisphosphatase n=1 Tax=Haloprofundus marisrubri TaxID=1514971 RepID=A0A0W1R713_9EURY|nr:inositol monophosphatase family protein [Haloprofundus marisrubri]KTG08882.1 hypothetical protein AUR64_13800 [Haloprofundus marisrubri]
MTMSRLDVATRAALAAGKRLSELSNPRDEDAAWVSAGDVVTEAAAESADELVERLGETDDAVFIQETRRTSDDGGTWVCDPLDGRGSYRAGGSEYAVSIAHYEDTRPRLGVVYLPDTQTLFAARADGPALRYDSAEAATASRGQRLSVTETDDLASSACVSGFDLGGHVLREFESTGAQVAPRESAAINLCRLADGDADVVWEYDTYPWDVAAGLVIAQAAGATVTDVDGDQYTAGREPTKEQRPLVATNGPLQTDALATIRGVDALDVST